MPEPHDVGELVDASDGEADAVADPHRDSVAVAHADTESVVDADGVGVADAGVGSGKEALGDTVSVDVGVYALDITVALDVGDCAVCDAGADALSDGDAVCEPLTHTSTPHSSWR